MALIRANTSGGGSGSFNYQYSGGVGGGASHSVTADHSADKLLIIINTISSLKTTIQITHKGTTYTSANFTESWDSGVNYAQLGLSCFVLPLAIYTGDVITYSFSSGTSSTTAILLVF